MFKGKLIITSQLGGSLIDVLELEDTYTTKLKCKNALKKLSSIVECRYGTYTNYDYITEEI